MPVPAATYISAPDKRRAIFTGAAVRASKHCQAPCWQRGERECEGADPVGAEEQTCAYGRGGGGDKVKKTARVASRSGVRAALRARGWPAGWLGRWMGRAGDRLRPTCRVGRAVAARPGPCQARLANLCRLPPIVPSGSAPRVRRGRSVVVVVARRRRLACVAHRGPYAGDCTAAVNDARAAVGRCAEFSPGRGGRDEVAVRSSGVLDHE